MDANTEQRILDQYDDSAALYDAYRLTLRDVAQGIARDLDIRALSITSRLKEKRSLRDKLQRKGEKYLLALSLNKFTSSSMADSC